MVSNSCVLCLIIILFYLQPNVVSLEVANQIDQILCDPLIAQGTAVVCSSPTNHVESDCTQPSVPGTLASYSCRNSRREIMSGLLNCSNDGYWISNMKSGNNSLCNLEASIINIHSPDIAISFGNPAFTTPLPDFQFLHSDFRDLNDFQKMALQIHNIFRRNHGVPFVAMAPLMNDAAQDIADFLASGKPGGIDSSKKLGMINSTSNIEMNWYLQVPVAANQVEAVSNAVQSWYSRGFPQYDWFNIGANLNQGNILSFTRIVWRSTKFIGIGVSSFEDITFVTALYTPGRAIGNPDPINEFQLNVFPPVRNG